MKLKNAVRLVVIVTLITAVGGNTLPAREKQEKANQDRKSFLEKGGHSGGVLSTMKSGGYTYIEFEENGKKLWAACRQANVSVGDAIEFGRALPMKNFHSRTLKRTFADILFVNRVTVVNAAEETGIPAQLPKGHVPVGPRAPTKITVEPGSVKKAENGYTVEECYSGKNSLAGKQVAVRGKVVKFSARIMERNWVHIRDGSGQPGTDDLTVTTGDTARVGDVVLVNGTIVYKKDFGAGYLFPVIIESASLIIEQTTGPDK